jgi:leucyl aminopeptidase
MSCYCKAHTKNSVVIKLILTTKYKAWFNKQSQYIKNFLTETNFKAESGNYALLLNSRGNLQTVLFCLDSRNDIDSIGVLPYKLPLRKYHLDTSLIKDLSLDDLMIAWGMGAYRFNKYKKQLQKPAQLYIGNSLNKKKIENTVESIYLVRDLINTPADDMTPSILAQRALELAHKYKATSNVIVGRDLWNKNYKAIYTVGRGSDNEPCLIDLTWGSARHPKLTLVGKGVCFDSGGLNLKPTSGMLGMKKDMGGAAHVLGLANMIMQAKLPLRLRVLIPAVENSVSGSSYHPGDVITMRNNKNVEITNTDAEGRLILADALVEASKDKPALLIDFATLTGAARVALGTQIAALFSNNHKEAECLLKCALQVAEPVWHMPLFANYKELLNSNIADLANSQSTTYGGAITAALFLQDFVDADITWMHFDIMGANTNDRPAHPKGGEAQALRAVFEFLQLHMLKSER